MPDRNVPPLSAWRRFLGWTLALCSGLVLPLAFAPIDWWPLAIGCVALLYLLIQRSDPRQACFLGWLFGLGYFGIGVHWIYFSLHLFGAAIAPLAALLTLVFVLVMTVFPAACCLLWAKLKWQDSPLLNVFLFASLWVVLELLRGKIMNGFPWILIGYSQTTGPLSEHARFVGVYGLSFLSVLASGLLIVLLFNSAKRIYAYVIVAMLLLSVFVVKVVKYSEPMGEPLAVRLVQGNIPQEMKFSQERLQRSLNLYVQMTLEPGLDETDLVVWPETAIPTYYHHVENALANFTKDMDARQIDVLSGVFQKDGEAEIYNAVRQLGGAQAIYRKRHLVPFGEYMPLRSVLEFAAKYIDIPMSDLAAGTGPHVPLTMQNGTAVGVSICYEDVYGEEMRALLPAAQVLVNVSNDAWFGNSAAPHQHEQKARMRALEFERPLIRVTNTGVSSAIDHRGVILGRIAHNEKGILDVTVQPRTGLTPYARTGNWPVFLFAAGIIGLMVTVPRLTRQRKPAF